MNSKESRMQNKTKKLKNKQICKQICRALLRCWLTGSIATATLEKVAMTATRHLFTCYTYQNMQSSDVNTQLTEMKSENAQKIKLHIDSDSGRRRRRRRRRCVSE